MELGLRRPEFRQDEDFTVVLWRQEGAAIGNDGRNGDVNGDVTGKDTGKDNGPDYYVLKLIKVVGNKTLTVKEMMEGLNLKGMDNFRKKYLKPAIKDGYVTLLYPDRITKKGQAYYLTELGKLLIDK